MGNKLVVFTYLLVEFITFSLQTYKFAFNLLQMNSQQHVDVQVNSELLTLPVALVTAYIILRCLKKEGK
jgi:hypothetical protein